MADQGRGAGSSDHVSEARPRSLSYLSSIFRRTVSISEPPPDLDEVLLENKRSRRFSESSLSEFDDDDHGNEVSDALKLHGRKKLNNINDVTDGSNQSSDNISGRGRSLTWSAMLLGSQGNFDQPAPSADVLPRLAEKSTVESGVFDANSSELSVKSSVALPTREISQTDHLNKRLLDSFLTRINSVASAFIDPGSATQPRSDDALMNTILKRVESDSGKKS